MPKGFSNMSKTIIDGKLVPKKKKRGYLRLNEDIESGQSITDVCSCCNNIKCNKCKSICNKCIKDCTVCLNDKCGCCGKFKWKMLVSKEAVFGYVIVVISLILGFINWKFGLITFICLLMGYVFYLQQRCCEPNTNNYNRGNNVLRNDDNNPRNGIMGINDLPKQNRGG